MVDLIIQLSEKEIVALNKLARRELREIHTELRYLLRQALKEQWLLADDDALDEEEPEP